MCPRLCFCSRGAFLCKGAPGLHRPSTLCLPLTANQPTHWARAPPSRPAGRAKRGASLRAPLGTPHLLRERRLALPPSGRGKGTGPIGPFFPPRRPAGIARLSLYPQTLDDRPGFNFPHQRHRKPHFFFYLSRDEQLILAPLQVSPAPRRTRSLGLTKLVSLPN